MLYKILFDLFVEWFNKNFIMIFFFFIDGSGLDLDKNIYFCIFYELMSIVWWVNEMYVVIINNEVY